MLKTRQLKQLNPLTDPFWDEEAMLMYDRMLGYVTMVAATGLTDGLLHLVPYGIELDLSLVNVAAKRFAETYTYDMVGGINSTTKGILRTKVSAWVEAGKPLPDLIESIAPWFGNWRASTIATTEVTRVYALGNIESWRQSGQVVGKIWKTAKDDFVCQTCRSFHGVQVSLMSFGFHAETVSLLAPPAHVNCRCELRPVVQL